MKNYIITILLVLGLGLLTSPLVSEAKADATPEVAATTETDETAFDQKDEITKIDIAEIADTAAITTTARTTRATTATTARNGYDYTITSYTGNSVSNLVDKPSYSDIYRTGKLVYAHNSSDLFGNIVNLGVGSTFTLTENGVTTTYRVSAVKYFKQIAVAGGEDLAECAGLSDNCSGRWMSSLVKNAYYHNVALMTCAGQSYGNGDASHRLIVLADQA